MTYCSSTPLFLMRVSSEQLCSWPVWLGIQVPNTRFIIGFSRTSTAVWHWIPPHQLIAPETPLVLIPPWYSRQAVSWQAALHRDEGSPARGSAHLSIWNLHAHLQSFHCNAVVLLHSTRYTTGDLSHFMPFTVKAALNSRVMKCAGRAAILVAVRSSIRRSQRGLQFPSASVYYLRCVTELFLRKLRYSTYFFLPPSII